MAQRISRRALAEHVASRLQAGDDTVLQEVAAYLLETRRVRELDLYVREIEAALTQNGVVVADVASAHQLTKKTEQAIVRYLKATYHVDTVEMKQSVDPQLIGGIQVRTPDAEYDATVRRKLTKLQTMKV